MTCIPACLLQATTSDTRDGEQARAQAEAEDSGVDEQAAEAWRAAAESSPAAPTGLPPGGSGSRPQQLSRFGRLGIGCQAADRACCDPTRWWSVGGLDTESDRHANQRRRRRRSRPSCQHSFAPTTGSRSRRDVHAHAHAHAHKRMDDTGTRHIERERQLGEHTGMHACVTVRGSSSHPNACLHECGPFGAIRTPSRTGHLTAHPASCNCNDGRHEVKGDGGRAGGGDARASFSVSVDRLDLVLLLPFCSFLLPRSTSR